MTTRIMTITMEVNEAEVSSLLARFAERGEVTVGGDGPVTNTTATADGEVDSAGVPWNPLYHAGSKGKKSDGTWTALRGMDDATKAAAAAYEASFKNPAPAATGLPDEGIPQFLQRDANGVTTPATPAAPVAPVGVPAMPVAPVAAPVPAPVTFEELSAEFTATIGRIGQDALMAKLGEIYAAAGVDSQGASLQTNETQRAQVLAAIKAL
jgi:hypothetical protein